MKNIILEILFALRLARRTWEEDATGRRVYALKLGIRRGPKPRKKKPRVEKNQLPLPLETSLREDLVHLHSEAIDRGQP